MAAGLTGCEAIGGITGCPGCFVGFIVDCLVHKAVVALLPHPLLYFPFLSTNSFS